MDNKDLIAIAYLILGGFILFIGLLILSILSI